MSKFDRQAFNKRIEITKCFDEYTSAQSYMMDNYYKKFYSFLLSDGRQVTIRMNDDLFVEMMGFNIDNITPYLSIHDKKAVAIHKQKFELIDNTIKGKIQLDIKRCLNRCRVIDELQYISFYNILGFIDIDQNNMMLLIKNERDFYSTMFLNKDDKDIYNITDIKNVNLETILDNKTLLIPIIIATLRYNGTEYKYDIKEANPKQISGMKHEIEDFSDEYNIDVITPSDEVLNMKLKYLK